MAPIEMEHTVRFRFDRESKWQSGTRGQKWCLNYQNVDSLEVGVGRAGDLRVGLIATHGLGAVEIGVNTGIHFVQEVGAMRTSRVRSVSSAGTKPGAGGS